MRSWLLWDAGDLLQAALRPFTALRCLAFAGNTGVGRVVDVIPIQVAIINVEIAGTIFICVACQPARRERTVRSFVVFEVLLDEAV